MVDMTRARASMVQPKVLPALVVERGASSSCKDEGGRASTCILPVAGKDFEDAPILLIL